MNLNGRPAPNLIGRKFNYLTVIERAANEVRGHSIHARWLCRCDCGKTITVVSTALRSGRTKSCGHARGIVKHRMVGTPEYSTWYGMITRCTNPRQPAYKNYGGRGITVCERWRNSFAEFFTDMGPRPEGLSLDRINNDGNYEPGNCRWATRREQRLNSRKPIAA